MSGRHEATDSDTRGPHLTALEELRSAVGGNVIVPGDETYDDARAVWNGMIDRRPAVIVRLGEEGEEFVRRSYGANFARLGEVKRKYDPLNVFRFNQNIKPG